MVTSKRDLTSLANQTYDVVIVGGGISGAWLALHCAQSGLRTALIEQQDYASQTSAASSKLLHSGIRYLQQMQFGKVRESALERAHYLYAAPHISKPIPFAVPTYKNFKRSKFFLGCGMLSYHALCLGENRIIDSKEEQLPRTSAISAQQLNNICDLSAEAHTGAVVFYERHMVNSERMALAILQSAQQQGAHIRNYVRAKQLLTENQQVEGLVAQDTLSGTEFKINAKLVINAAGPWIDGLNLQVNPNSEQPSINGYAVGSHIITRQLCDHAIALTTKHKSDAKIDRGGRHVFIIPWRGHSLIGTSYDECETAKFNLDLDVDHVVQLLEVINDALPNAKLEADDLISGYSGIYPLHTDNIDSNVYQGSGEYRIIDHAKSHQLEGLITALGAKYTTGRKLSALTMKLVGKHLDREINLDKAKLHSTQYSSLDQFTQQKYQAYSDLLPQPTISHLINHYGSDLDALINRIQADPVLLQPIAAHLPDIMGQVVWAVEQEQAVNLEDVLFRRTSIGFFGIDAATIHRVAEQMATICGWSPAEQESQAQDNIERIRKTKATLEQGLSEINNAYIV